METKNATTCYEELKDKKMTIPQFKTYLDSLPNLARFAGDFLNIVNEDIKGGHKNLDTIIETLRELLLNNDLTEETKDKVIDTLIKIANKIQENQWTPKRIMELMGMLLTFLAIILGIENLTKKEPQK